MKALTICQPFAELIMRGEKLVENRTWETAYRGRLLIHAGKSEAWLRTYSPLPDHMDFGCIVGSAHLIGIMHVELVKTHRRIVRYIGGLKHVSGPFCWILAEVKRFEKPIPYRGAQGLFDVPEEIILGRNPTHHGAS